MTRDPRPLVLGLFTDLQSLGGVQRACRHVAASLRSRADREGRTTTFLTVTDPPGRHGVMVGDQRVTFTGAGSSRTRLLGAVAAAARHRPRAVLLGHPGLAPLGVPLARLLGVPSLVIAWGVDVWDPLPLPKRLALQHADRILAISTDTARHLTDTQGVRPDRVRPFPLALDPDLLALAKAPAPKEEGSADPATRRVLTVSRLSQEDAYKGVDHLIEAFADLAKDHPDLELVIVGDGDDRPRLAALAAELGVETRVRFKGAIGWDDPEGLATVYRSADVFALPSGGEGFGLVFLEAMAFGVPVLGGAHGGTPDIIRDRENGMLVTHGDVATLTARLRELLTDEALASTLAGQASKDLHAHYTFEALSERLDRELDQLLTDDPVAPHGT